MIALIPTGGSNLGSVEAALRRLGAEVLTTEEPDLIRQADRVILPGVGHAATMMAKLRSKKLDMVLKDLTQPVLGICLGMQLLFESSEEGNIEGLGIIPGRVVAIPRQGLAIPHMGWNQVSAVGSEPIAKLSNGNYYYFVHSYMAENGPWTQAQCGYGSTIPAIVRWKNFYGTQFHPERSGAAGEALLAEFICMN